MCYEWRDGEGQAKPGYDGPCGGEGQARGLVLKDQNPVVKSG